MFVIFTYSYLDSRTFIIGFAYGYQISREIGFAHKPEVFAKKMIAYFRIFLLFLPLYYSLLMAENEVQKSTQSRHFHIERVNT